MRPDLATVLQLMFPTLSPHADYRVENQDPDGSGALSLVWLTTEVEEPSPAEIDAFVVPLATQGQVIAERDRRLALGFDYDFTDARGVHRIGTTTEDMAGWDEVSKFSQALQSAGQGSQTINIVTDTGATQVTADEWALILIAAGVFRQPIWAASFMLQAATPIPADYADNSYWP